MDSGLTVNLDGSGSSDPDEDPLTYLWGAGAGVSFDDNTSATPAATFSGLGTYTITLEVDDGNGGTDTDDVYISVVDTTAPVIISAGASPDKLWPPNHKMREATVSVDVTDACDDDVTCVITLVTSDEPVNGKGDGNTTPDWNITGDLTVDLRAERSGKGDGRVYTITVVCTDDSGNQANTTMGVTVPHDKGKKK